ncbi:hypothetical protein CAPTEDRAFT_223554 [Capitella teleta]|uniref:PDZ domain-containing protein n=1 Tax=Capitella teleta TaxID=283909 RepID=R7UGS2_CAPTE|nr:hypothetical protein CAPTEDRAFT_223554 [Capitella teleta]|eukprot:ELU05744.1 hypothetical protein CAPTEDRAFT_223554 [Capitella teleta]
MALTSFEHGIGVFVSHVVSASQADTQGLAVGDELVRVNGFTIQQAVHQEVLNLIKTQTELLLKVRNIGMLPVKDNHNEHVTWRYVDNIDNSKALQEVLDGEHSKRTPWREPIEAKIFICLPVGANLGCSISSASDKDGGIYVQSVQEESYAEEAGLRIGDQLLQVNGTPFTNISHSEAMVALKGSRHLNIIIRRNADVKSAVERSRESTLKKLTTDENHPKQNREKSASPNNSITLPKQQDLIQQAIKVLEQKEAEQRRHAAPSVEAQPPPPPPLPNPLGNSHPYATITKDPLNISRSAAASVVLPSPKSNRSSQMNPVHLSTDDNYSYRIQKPVLLHPTSRASQEPVYSTVNDVYEEVFTRDSFNPNQLFTNEQIAGRVVKLINVKKGESRDLGVVIDRYTHRSQPGIVVTELYEDGAFHKHGGVGIGDEILLLDGISLQGKSTDDARELLRKAFQSSPKIPLQLVLAKAPANYDTGPDVPLLIWTITCGKRTVLCRCRRKSPSPSFNRPLLWSTLGIHYLIS